MQGTEEKREKELKKREKPKIGVLRGLICHSRERGREGDRERGREGERGLTMHSSSES